jgi:S1-C subfamily serine protease
VSSRESQLTKILAVLLLIVAGALVFTVIQLRRQTAAIQEPAIVAEPRPIAQRPDDKLGADEQATMEVFKKYARSVVSITSLDARRDQFSLDANEPIQQGTGTGFVWDTSGHIVTNFHVIAHGDRASVTLNDNSSYPARIIGRAPDKDLAVLKIDAPAQKLQPLPVGTSANLEVGQKVLAIGNPYNVGQTLTTGVISGLGREIKSMTRRSIFDVIQTDASINPGNSGGPLLDSAGRLIGVNTAIYSPSGASAGIGFAVPVDTVNAIVPQLLKFGQITRPGLGINIFSDQMATQYKIDGVVIRNVTPGGPADRAGITGIAPGPNGGVVLGDVIVKVDAAEIQKASDLYRALDSHKVGDEVDLVLQNSGQRRTVKVTLAALP